MKFIYSGKDVVSDSLKDRAEILMADGRASVNVESVKEGDPFD